MTEENRQETTNNSQWSISPDFAKFLLTIVASFVGSLIAICLFSAVIRPPERPYCPMMIPPSFDAPYYGAGEYRPDCPYKRHKMEAKRKDFEAPVKKDVKTDKK